MFKLNRVANAQLVECGRTVYVNPYLHTSAGERERKRERGQTFSLDLKHELSFAQLVTDQYKCRLVTGEKVSEETSVAPVAVWSVLPKRNVFFFFLL